MASLLAKAVCSRRCAEHGGCMCVRSLPLPGKEQQAEREETRGGCVRELALHGLDHNPSATRTVGAMLDETTFAAAAAELCAADPDLAGIVEAHGLPEFWAREPGFPTLVLLILEQQVSLASARAAYDRLETRLGGMTPLGIAGSSDEELRADGFSRQKNRYVRALSAALLDGSLDLDAVALLDDHGVRSALVALPGIGPWTAEVYLLSALRRPDTWPVGDIALQEAARRARGLEARPSPDELEAIGEAWRPNRATAARILWHLYLSDPQPVRRAAARQPPAPGT
jgi:DNA-3-methyladenine glycosylase II